MFALLLAAQLGFVVGKFSTLEPAVIKDTYQGSEFDVGQWGPITMSSDGTMAAAATNGYGAESDYVWVSTDSTTTSARKTSELANEVVMSRDGSKLFAVRIEYSTRTSGHKIRVSTDHGSTWSDTGAATTQKWSCLAVSNDGTKMVAGAWDGNLWLSSDTGATWTDTGLGPQQWHALAMSADGSIIAAGTNGNKLWGSQDGGATITEVPASPSTKWRAIAMTPTGSKIVAASQQGGVWMTTDIGQTVTELAAADSKVYRGVAISDDGMTIVANNCCGGENWVSLDGGATALTFLHNGNNQYWEKIAISGDGKKVIATSSQDSGRIYMALATTTTTTAANAATTAAADSAGSNVVEVAVTLTVDDPTAITGNEAVTNAMIVGFAVAMGVQPSQVTLTFQVSRRLEPLGRMLQSQMLTAIFAVTFPSAQEAQQKQTSIQQVSVADTNTAITTAVAATGYSGTLQVTGKEAKIQAAISTTKAGFTDSSPVHRLAATLLLGLIIPYF